MHPKVLIIVETSLSFGRAVLRGINRYMITQRRWSISLDLRELMAKPPDWLETWQGDGIISRSTSKEFADLIRKRGLPMVDLTDIIDDVGFPTIRTNQESVARLAAKHLIERGFKNFAFCGFSEHRWSKERQLGFVSELKRENHECFVLNSPWTTDRAHTWEQQQELIVSWLESLPKPVGVFACNDFRGLHVLDACQRIDVHVPEQVAVIGADNDTLLCGLTNPPLTSVILNPERIGYEAAALLDQLMQVQATATEAQLVEPMGIEVRQSTDVLAIDDPQIALAVRIIRERACSGLTVAEILREVPLSRSSLERRFRHYLGRSPQAEIRSVQVKRISELLRETDLTLEQIARKVSFTHPEYLSVVFKREMGESPGRYRKRQVV